ncbi:MAG: hypothetical protein ACYT04_60640 [Nostoc sp.]
MKAAIPLDPLPSLREAAPTGRAPRTWVERDSRPAAWGIGHRALVTSSPCPMPHSPCPKTPSPCGWSFLFLLSISSVSWRSPADRAAPMRLNFNLQFATILRKAVLRLGS